MTQVYLNGSSPDYFGFVFTTATELLDEIETTLVSAGWTTVSKSVGTNLFIRGVTEQGTPHNCWVEFTITGTSPDLIINMQGWLEEEKINGSGTQAIIEDVGDSSFTVGFNNRLWLSANSESFAFCLINSNGRATGWHFGFCNRTNTEDQWAIYIGEISCRAYKYARVAKLYDDPTVLWTLLGNGFSSSSNGINPGAGSHICPSLHLDFMSRAFFGTNNSFSTVPYMNSSTLMPDRSNYSTTIEHLSTGMINAYTGKPLIAEYGLIEGASSNVSGTYLSQQLNPDNYERFQQRLSFRGWIHHCVTGLSGERAGYQWVSNDGSIYLSVGPGRGFQGIRIK